MLPNLNPKLKIISMRLILDFIGQNASLNVAGKLNRCSAFCLDDLDCRYGGVVIETCIGRVGVMVCHVCCSGLFIGFGI